jgi:hypothetical protein
MLEALAASNRHAPDQGAGERFDLETLRPQRHLEGSIGATLLPSPTPRDGLLVRARAA